MVWRYAITNILFVLVDVVSQYGHRAPIPRRAFVHPVSRNAVHPQGAPNRAPYSSVRTSSPPVAMAMGMSFIVLACALMAVDGDTLRCGEERIRLLGIDAPEMPGHCREGRECAPGDPIAAKAALEKAVQGSATIERIGQDLYARTLARVRVNGVDLSCLQLSKGHAIYRPDWDQFMLVGSECGAVPSSAAKPVNRTTGRAVQRPAPRVPANSWSYRNCAEARRAGAAPLRRGQPGYGAHMDGDGDGIACEPYRR
ncbi:thermonuclease family protein [Sphingomonas sp. Leaf25]|uniref:thermonuclease family protein n=1 Tax=Sphingomonas sp. Leaf25 TaxID=1735692 RepID=UPI000B171B52|nr:thermonuclease family protein [Sphingomonas sp. Leaf25]